MQQYKMLTRTILMLSIINFTLPAPLPVRERPEVRLDANVARNMTAASQKRGDSSGSTKVPGPDLALPPSPDSTDTILRLIDFGPPYSPESSTGYVQPSPISPTGSQLPAGSMPVASTLLSSPPEKVSMDVPGPHHTPVPTDWSESMQHVGFGMVGQHRQTNNPPLGWGELPNLHRPDHTPVPSLDSTPWSELTQYVKSTMEAQHRQIHSPLPPWADSEPLDWGTLNVPVLDHVPPPSPDFAAILSQIPHADSPPTLDSLGSSTGSHYVPPSPGPPTGLVGPMPVVGSLSPLPPPLPHPNEPGLSDDRYPPGFEPKPGSSHDRYSPGLEPKPDPGPSHDRYPPGFEPKPNTLPSTGSTGTQPISPQPESQGVDPETHPLLNSETFPIEFWNKLFKGKVKRRISGSNSVGLAQKDPRSRLF